MEMINEEELKSSNGKDYIYSKTFKTFSSLSDNPIHLICTHDLLQHQNQWLEFIECSKLDCMVTLWDLPGHGISGGERNHCHDYRSWIIDLEQLIAKHRLSQEKTILIGQGLGASINLAYLTTTKNHSISGAIFLNPLIGVHWAGLMSRINLIPKIMTTLRLPFPYGPHEMNFDMEMANAQILDTNFHNVLTVGMVNQINALLASIEEGAGKLDLPNLLVLSVDGPLMDLQATEAWFSKKGGPRSASSYFPPLSHNLIAEGQRKQIFEDLTEWLKQFRSNAKL